MDRADVRLAFAAHVAATAQAKDGMQIPEYFVMEFLDFKEKSAHGH